MAGMGPGAALELGPADAPERRPCIPGPDGVDGVLCGAAMFEGGLCRDGWDGFVSIMPGCEWLG